MTTKRDSQRYSRQGLSLKARRLIIGNLFRAGSLMFVLMAAVISVSGQVPEDFGYNRLQALGPRPLLVILTQFDGYPAFEGNGDGVVTNSELEILIVDNLTGNGFERSASTRWSDPKCFAIDDGKRTLLCLKASLVGQSASFMSMAHELLHSLGISAKSDIYGSNDNSQGYTTMDATIYSELEDRRT